MVAKYPKANLKLHYRETLELALIVSLLMVLVIMHTMPKIKVGSREFHARALEIEVENIPPTEQVRQTPPPPRPTIPVPTENEEVPEDLTIASTELDWTQLPPPPERPVENDIDKGYVFVPYDKPPAPIGGMAAIQKHLGYPELARKAGVEGLVVIGVLIDEHGNPVKTQILKESRVHIGFEEAARAAVMAVKWKPAKQRDRTVKVWVSIPIAFKLKESERRPIS
ncbi:MAG: energy transducer TonB [bacterium]